MKRWHIFALTIASLVLVPFGAAWIYDRSIPKLPRAILADAPVPDPRWCFPVERELIRIFTLADYAYANADFGLSGYFGRSDHANCLDEGMEYWSDPIPDPVNPALYHEYLLETVFAKADRVHAFLEFADRELASLPRISVVGRLADLLGLYPDRRGYHHGLGLLRDVVTGYLNQSQTTSFWEYARCGYQIDLKINREAYDVLTGFDDGDSAVRHAFGVEYLSVLYGCYNWVDGATPAADVLTPGR
ncbi:MAG: hypothetical protein JKP98_21705 [Rhodobacteraceae bacterium]|jgi:hypothetical protein|nr:hypothetical protein [Paracoccaceae bacterium]MBL4558729.1 hypothetical protein [Paracoccaceae bacterium]HBG98429.1 hypothetical protein [Paracoccaceae bacterium]